ncbi:MAG: hypothetical protein LBT40_11515 [Deltaproteobacteria bacterium]|jgi:uncharacterized protein YoxC|nr:hypothetical protein [Deltaproteobacteria bacterium]
MTNPNAETAEGLSDVTGESAGQISFEQLLKTLGSASAAQRASYRRLLVLDSADADGTEGVSRALQVAVSPEAGVHWVTRHQFAVGIAITVAVAFFAVLFSFALYSLDSRIDSLDNRLNLLTSAVSGLSKEVADLRVETTQKISSLELSIERMRVEMNQRISGLELSIERLHRDMGSASGASREQTRPPGDPARAGSPGRSAPPDPEPEVPAPE